MVTRRKFVYSLLAAGAAGATYLSLNESSLLEVSEVSVSLPGTSCNEPVRMLHISDIHVDDWNEIDFIESAILRGLSLKPDLIFLTGDFITRRLELPESYRTVLCRLAVHAPTYACPGNHDGGLWIAPHGGYATSGEICAMLEESGITCLVNRAESVTVKKRSFTVVGLGDVEAGEFDPAAAFDRTATGPETATVVLSHNPDTKEALAVYDWDLLLCGHTHGGQIRLPLIGPLLLPVKDRRYVDGLYRWRGRRLHISRGLGSLFGIRINCRPQISLITA